MGWAGRLRRRLPPPPGGLEGLRRPRGQEQVAVQTEEVPPLAAELAQVVYPCLGLAPCHLLLATAKSAMIWPFAKLKVSGSYSGLNSTRTWRRST